LGPDPENSVHKQDDGSRRNDCLLDSCHLETAEVVEDHFVSGLESWAQELTHISQNISPPIGPSVTIRTVN
jgi:hypothetical protein